MPGERFGYTILGTLTHHDVQCTRLAYGVRTLLVYKVEFVNRIVTLLSAAVRRAPVIVLLVAIVITVGLGSFVTQTVQGGGNEGFSPDNPELLAQQTIQEAFGSSGDTILQILLQGQDGQDLISPAGVQATAALQQALQDSDIADLLVQRDDQPPVVSPLAGVLQAGAAMGTNPMELDEEVVDQLFAAALQQMPVEQSGFVTGLLPEGTDPAEATSDTALAIVFLDSEALPSDDTEAAEAIGQVADVINTVEVEGVDLQPFAFELLFGEQDAFASEIGRLFGLALLIIVLILAFVYFVTPKQDGSWGSSIRRTAADVGLTMLVVVMAIMWVQGAAGLLGPGVLGIIGPASELVQILPVLLIGLGVDYGIHLTSRYRDEVRDRSVPDAIDRATATVGIALILATITTAVGFLTNVVSPVPALKDFGILAAVGIIAAFVLMLTVFPAARLLLDRRAEAKGVLPRQTMSQTSEGALPKIMGKLAVLAEKAAVLTLVLTVGVGGVLGAIGLANVSTEFSFTDFLPKDSPLVVTFNTIVEQFGGGFGETSTVVIDGPVDADTHNAMVAANEDLAAVDDVMTFGPNAAAASPVSVLGQVLLSLAPDQAESPVGGLAEPVDPALAGQVAAMVEPGGLRVPDDTDVSQLYDLLLQAAPTEAGQVIAPEDDVFLFTIQTEAGEQGAEALADNLNATFEPVAQSVGPDGSVVATSDNIITTRITSSLRDSQLQSLLITVLAAMLLLVITYWVTQRRPFLGFITIAPVALIVLWTFAAMAATDIPVGPVTATIAALAVGIGVPYTIHVTNRWTEDRRNYATPEQAIRSTVSHTGGALAGSAFTTMAGFGILMTSSLTPFQQFGQVTVYAIGFALLAATVVLPSMLVLYDRFRRQRGDDPFATGTGRAPQGEKAAVVPDPDVVRVGQA